MKKLFLGILAAAAAALGAVCFLGVGTDWIVRKGASYVAETYNIGVSYSGASGNPVTGYRISDLKLISNEKPLIEAGKITVDPALLKLIRGAISLDWVELSDIRTTIPHLQDLAEIFTGSRPAIPASLPLQALELKTLGGSLDGSSLEGALEIAVNGMPLKAEFSVDISSGVVIRTGRIETAGGRMTVSGTVLPALNLKAEAEKLQLASFGALFPQIGACALKGLASASITASGAFENPAVKGSMALTEGSAMGIPFAVSTDADFRDMKLRLDRLSAQAAGIPAAGSVSVDLKAASPVIKADLKTSGAVTAKTLAENLAPYLPAGMTLGGQVDGLAIDLEGPADALKGSAELRADRLTANGQTISDTLVRASFGDKGTVTLNAGTNFAGNRASMKAALSSAGKKRTLTAEAHVKDFDLATLHAVIPAVPENLKGRFTASISAKGSPDNPAISARIDSKRISLGDMRMDNISVPAAIGLKGPVMVTFKNAAFTFMDLPVSAVNGSISMPDSKGISVKEMSAQIAGGRLSVNSELKLANSIAGHYDMKLSGLDLGTVMKIYQAQSLNASGKLSAAMKGDIAGSDITGTGSLQCPKFTVLGLAFEDVKAPLTIEKGLLAKMNRLTARFAGGTVSASANVDVNAMTYSLDASLGKNSLRTIIDTFQYTKTLGGGLTGLLSGAYKASGKLNPFTLKAEGVISSSGGELYGFSKYKTVIDLALKLVGNKKLAYKDAKIPFSMDADSFTLGAETAVNAPDNDGIYKYLACSGTLAYAGALNMDVKGSINTRLVNMAVAGVSGALSASAAGTILTGGAGGAAAAILGGVALARKENQNVYQEASFHIGGTVNSPRFSDYRIAGKKKSEQDLKNDVSSSLSSVGNLKEKAEAKIEDAKTQLKKKVEEKKQDVVNKLLGGKTSSEKPSVDDLRKLLRR